MEEGGTERIRELLKTVAEGDMLHSQSGIDRYRVQIAPTAAHHPQGLPRESTIVVTDRTTGTAVMITALGSFGPRAWGRTSPADSWRPLKVSTPGLPGTVANLCDSSRERRPECPKVKALTTAAVTNSQLKQDSSLDAEVKHLDHENGECTRRISTSMFLTLCGETFHPARNTMGRPGWVLDLQEENSRRCQLIVAGDKHAVSWAIASPRGQSRIPTGERPNPKITALAVDLVTTLMLTRSSRTPDDWPDGPHAARLLAARAIERPQEPANPPQAGLA